MRKVLFLTTFLVIAIALPHASLALDIKNADLSGSWYPANKLILSHQIENYLKKAEIAPVKGEVIAIISPHAGIKYSGQVSAYGFKAVKDKQINTVIVVGFNHAIDYDGIAVFDKDGIKTPLGVLHIEKDLSTKLINSHKKIFSKIDAFQNENSIELILPFIQTALGNPKVVLIAIGRQDLKNCEILGASLYQVLKDRQNFLIIASTDMSHYLSYNQANETDAKTIDLIKKMEPEELFLSSHGKNRMCGTASVVSTMIAAKKLGANTVQILKQANSGDVLWDKNRVVGYLSAAFIKEDKKKIAENEKMEEKELLSQDQKNKLLKLARDTIRHFLTTGKTLEVKEDDPILKQTMGAFVTLHKKGQLRGCIGNIIGTKALYLTVRDMAIASATEDPRFSSVTKDELPDIDIEISALSPLKKITNHDEIILGKHGVLVKDFFRSGVYLPQVATETGWTKEQFMSSLCASKAGIAPDAWKTGKCEIYIFSAEVFRE
ncbi:MAG: AmmeMemoRadiSam system protein B [Candidatus Omnitrophica bacterium]|nr:AmmeMemoRadiSam system protein B [Candidatus Omnitrophota bacterium]